MPKKNFKKNNEPHKLGKISSISLENFKGFEKKTNLNFSAGINLIYGRNSAGKSSIIQALRLLKQSLYIKSSPCSFHLVVPTYMRIPGSLTFPEGFKGLINKKNLSKNLVMGLGTFGSGVINKDGTKYRTERIIEHEFSNRKNLKFPNINSIYLSRKDNYEDSDKVEKQLEVNLVFKKNTRFKNDHLAKILTDADKNRNISGHNVLGMLKALNEKRLDLIKEDTEFQYLDVNNSSFNFSIYDELFDKIHKNFEKNSKEILKNIEYGLTKTFGLELDTVVKNIKKGSKKKKKKATSIRETINLENDGRYVTIGKNELKSLKKFIKSPSFKNKDKFKDFLYSNLKKKLKLIRFRDEFFDVGKIETELKMFEKIKDLPILHPTSYIIYIHDLLLESVNLKKINLPLTYERTLLNIRYAVDLISVVPGLRQLPARYLRRGLEERYVGENAENIGDLLSKKDIKKEVNYWFNRLEVPYEIDTKLVGNFFELIMKPKSSNVSLSYKDVGLGYSLSLPLIITSLTSTNSIILCEEPELHLHPKMQSALMELFMHSTLKNRNQFIIETHSENILLRAQKLIRKGFNFTNKNIKIKKDFINIFNVYNSDRGSEVQKIELDNFGEFKTHWRDGFFSERLDELF